MSTEEPNVHLVDVSTGAATLEGPFRVPRARRTPRLTSRARARASRQAAEQIQTPSLDELIAAYRTPGRPEYDVLREAYQLCNGLIRDNYFAKHIHAGALVVKPRGLFVPLTQTRKINLRYDSVDATAVQPEFESAIWRARALERESALTLGGRSRRVLVEMLYTILVYLLSVLDAAKAEDRRDVEHKQEWLKRVDSALESANRELDRLCAFAEDAAKKASLRWYLLGLPAGALVGAMLIAFAESWASLAGPSADDARLCVACGAVGAIVSVMTRVSRGLQMIDSQQGNFVTTLAGAFRPLIGGIFGLAVYVFVQGGLIPIDTPDDAGKQLQFFAALAFLSGFSERWAQDSIVQSAPLALNARPAGGSPAERPAGAKRRPRGTARHG